MAWIAACLLALTVAILASYMQGASAGAIEDFEDATSSPCEEINLITCFLPFVAFAVSDEAKDYTPARAKGVITQPQLTRLCDLGNDTAICFRDYTKRCIGSEHPEVHLTAQGTIDFLQFCTKPDAHSKVQKLFSCAQTMEAIHNRCAKSSSSMLPTDVDPSSPTAMVKRPNALRDLCCHVKKYEGCYLPEVQTHCGAEGVTANQDFLQRIYTSYQCSKHFPNCPA
ncbi:hypothetical protein BV898_04444 [Hypsibius exemplaris]|uniref:DUF19 domain-containing protein n=1 Tax=Hypsibius exemplaris TaxID=2072580 RepID=A0A1W0X2H8_HYPEX|nr:hypothetical protein BV898_04444 [Hypsibius exemplaris]